MQQYYENNFKETIQEIGKLSAERSDGCSDSEEAAAEETGLLEVPGEEKKQQGQQIPGQAGKGMVDVPDPPEAGEEKATPKSGGGEKKEKKVHHFFVKAPAKRTAKFERMVRRHRSFEHEAKVYSELLHDLQAFVKTRVGDAVELKIPMLDPMVEGSNFQEDNHNLVVE